MAAVSRRRNKAKVPIERRGGIVFRVDGERAHSRKIGDLQRAPQGIEQQPCPDAAALLVAMHGKTRQNHKRYRIARHSLGDAFRRVGVLHFAYHERIKSDHRLVAGAHISLRRPRLLRLQRVANKEAIKFRLAAGECFDLMRSMQLFYAQRVRHGSGSKTDGSRNSRSRRG